MAGGPSRLLDPVARAYRQGLARHGATPAGVFWRDEAGQRLRFTVLAQVIEKGHGPVTVNDLGCGYGALFDYLDQALGDRLGRYVGYDISPEMLDAARARIGDARAAFRLGDTVDLWADYGLVSGAYNLSAGNDPRRWQAYVFDSIERLAAKSRKGLAFNMLRPRPDRPPQANLFYAEPEPFVELCARRFGAERVTLVEGYPLEEWTMLVRLTP